MKIGTAFPSKYLKASDLQGRRIKVTIDSADLQNIGDDEDKLVIYFVGKDKGMVCNRTNANMIAEILGTEETDEWHGQSIVLYSTKVDFQGRRVDAIRVDAVPDSKPKLPPPPPPPSPPLPPPQREPGSDDDIPW